MYDSNMDHHVVIAMEQFKATKITFNVFILVVHLGRWERACEKGVV